MATSYLPKPITKIELAEGHNAQYQYAVANCQGWRTTQEDAHLAIPNFQKNTSLFGVFDGHNGPEVAQWLAKYFPLSLFKNNNFNKGLIKEGLREIFMILDESLVTDKVNETLFEMHKKKQQELSAENGSAVKVLPDIDPKKHKLAEFVGSTGVVLVIKNDTYYVANVGDTRCILMRNKHAILLSHDHKAELPDEKARIEKAGGFVKNGRVSGMLDVSRSFGDAMFKQTPNLKLSEQMVTSEPYVASEPIKPKDDQFILLICDGIWNAMDNQVVADFVAERIADDMPLSKICEEVIQQILPTTFPTGGGVAGKDNMTIMIIKPIKSVTSDSLKRASTTPRMVLQPTEAKKSLLHQPFKKASSKLEQMAHLKDGTPTNKDTDKDKKKGQGKQ